MLKPVSEAEKVYIREGCSLDIRSDGRGLNDFRPISIENNVFPHVHGSARVQIGEDSDIICAIKLEVGEPLDTLPDQGTIEVYVDISQSCRIQCDERVLSTNAAQIAENLQKILISSNAIDLTQFCIIPSKYCWVIHIDLLILKMDGDPTDISSIASLVALDCLKVPKVELSVGESGTMEDFSISGDLSHSSRLKVNNVPVCVTLSKIGSSFVVDSNSSEQACADCILCIAIDSNGKCCGLTYIKSGSLKVNELSLAIAQAQSTAKAIFMQLDGFHEAMAAMSISGNNKQEMVHGPDIPPIRMGLLA
eukprot:gene5484-7593_t